MTAPALLFVANLASTWFLTGLIWTIQLVHYPLFDRVGREGFASYEGAHARMITPMVGPAMLIEALTAALLLMARPRFMPAWAAWAGVALVGIAWLSTFLLQVPMHGTLARGFDVDAHARLVGTNWIRTAAWTARAVLLAWCAWAALEAADHATAADPTGGTR
jgi:hypothetical protein